MPSEIKSIGFIGLGQMGARQGREIAKLPLSLTVFDERREAMHPFEGTARLASSIAELGASSDLVGICVQDDDQVNACAAELLPAMKPGSVILIHSTVHPATVTALAERAKALGIEVRDAPVTRTRMTEEGPCVFCPMGGDEAVKARVQAILDAFATDTLLVGPIGSAMALKICNNLVSWCEIAVALEALALAQSAGIPSEILLGLMGSNGLLTPPMKVFAGFRTQPPPGDSWREGVVGAARMGEKDLKLAEQLAIGVGARSPIASFLRGIVKDAILQCVR